MAEGEPVLLVNNSMWSADDPDLQAVLNTARATGYVPDEQWRVDEIIKGYRHCVEQPEYPANSEGLDYCPRIFDGWSCWNYTRPGEAAYVNCPHFVVGMEDPRRKAVRMCLPSGDWFRHPEFPNSSGWSNYTSCVDVGDLELRQLVNKVYLYGYSVSLAAILISLIIFMCFRSALNSKRVRIHTNLFISFMINNLMWIIWYEFIVHDIRLLKENPIWCRAIHIFVHYFMVANYFWMFCEGLYLHTLLAVAFVTESKLMRWLYLVGWILPIFFVAIYSIVRGVQTAPTEATWCWMAESSYIYLLSVPVVTSMVVNFIFLIRIVWILVRKLRAAPGNEEHNNSWRAVRATLILIPLLGLNYMLAPFRPAKDATGENVYQVVSAVSISMQGFCVALLFCFANGEVLQQFKKKWQQMHIMHGKPPHTSIAFTTISTLPPETSVASDCERDKVHHDQW